MGFLTQNLKIEVFKNVMTLVCNLDTGMNSFKKLRNEIVEKLKGVIFATSNQENGEVAQLVRAHDS